MLHDFVRSHRADLLARAGSTHRPVVQLAMVEPGGGIPMFLDQLVTALKSGAPSPEVMAAIERTATIHGGYLLDQGLTVSEVVHDYGDVCQAVTELARETHAPITTDEFHTLNRCLDDAIARAVTEHGRRREKSILDAATLRMGVMAHELRNRLSAANMGFHLILRGSPTAKTATSSLVSRNLDRMTSIIQRSLVEVRVDSGLEHREPVLVSALLEEAEADGSMEAVARDLTFSVSAIGSDVRVRVDRQVVSGAIANLLQNAFKFTRPRTHVALKASVTAERVLIEVEDACGGLPPARTEQLFEAFQQHGEDRSGLGLGLFLSRRAIESSGGRLLVRDLPGQGCVFSIDLPRLVDTEW